MKLPIVEEGNLKVNTNSGWITFVFHIITKEVKYLIVSVFCLACHKGSVDRNENIQHLVKYNANETPIE